MATTDHQFAERFSALVNALQVAAALSREHSVQHRAESAAADQLHDAVVRAVEACRLLRPDNGSEPA